MTTAYPMPDASKVKSMLGLLFDGLDVKPGRKFEVLPTSGCWVGLYVSDAGVPAAACIADVALAANAGAALSMLPPAVAKDAAKSKQLTDVMVGNLREVLNICTRLLMTDTSAHLRLAEVFPATALPAGVATVLSGQKGRVDFELTVPKYGPGTLAVVST